MRPVRRRTDRSGASARRCMDNAYGKSRLWASARVAFDIMRPMRSELDKPTLGALRARRQGWRMAMEILYPRLRVRRKRVARALNLEATIGYEPPQVQFVAPRSNVLTALIKRCSVLVLMAIALGTAMLLGMWWFTMAMR